MLRGQRFYLRRFVQGVVGGGEECGTGCERVEAFGEQRQAAFRDRDLFGKVNGMPKFRGRVKFFDINSKQNMVRQACWVLGLRAKLPHFGPHSD